MNSKFKTVAGLFISILAGVALHAQHNITLQASPAAGGSVAAYADSGTVPLTAEQLRAVRGNPFATIRLSGSTNPGYEFNGWESSGGAEDKLPTILAGSAMIYSATTTLTANFSLRTYPLTVIVNPFEGGRAAGISGDRTRFVANEHAVLEVTGCPPDWEFVKWNVLSDQGGAATVASPTNRTTQVTLGTPADNGWVIEAEFRKVIDASKNAIIVSAAAGGYVVVKGSGTIAGGNNETFIGEEGQLLSMEAKPASSINYAFTGWEGVTGAGASLPNISVTFANTPQTVKAHFQAKSLKLTVRTDPASAGELTAKSGAVMFSSAGDSVGVSGSIPYNALTTLVASTPPGSNYDFDKFETSPPDFLPNLNINGDTATFSHTQNALVVTAKFKKLTDLNMLTVTSNTGGGVHVSGSYNTYANPALSPEANPVITKTVDVAAGTAEQVSFAQDTVVRLEANPAENYAFERWTDESGYTQGIEASGTISIPMIADRRITATFTRVASFLDVEVYPQAAFAAGARVKVAGTELPDRVSRSTHPSSLGWLAVQATGSGIWEFSHWESAGWPQIHGNNQASIGFDMSVDRSIRAVFVTKHRVTVTTSPAGAGGSAYLFEGENRGGQMDYNTNAVATVYAEKTSPQWHFTGFTIAPSGGAMITVGGSPDPVNPARIRHQFEVTGDTTVTANFVQAVSGQMWVKKVTASNLNAEEDITLITDQDKLNIHGDSYVPHGDLLVPVRIVPPAASLSPFYFQPGGTIRLEAPESLDYPDGHTYRFVQWRVGVDSNNNGSWTPRAWGNYPARSVDYSIPSGATALIFYACYTDERLIQARVMLDNTLQTQSAVAAKGIAVKYNNAALAVGTDAVDNNLQYSDTGASLEVTVGGAAPAPAAPAGAAGAPRAAGARSAAAPAAAAAAAPAAGDDVIFRGWRVAGQSGGGANSIENPANPQTWMAVRADGSLTADFKSKVVLNLAIKTIPEGAALSLGTMVSGTNVTTGETLALGGGSTKSLSFGRGDTVTFTAEPEIRIGTDAYHFAGWDQNGNGEFEESERTGPGGFTPDTSPLASSATVFYERMHKLTVEISPANDNYYGTVSIETVQIPAERLPYTDEYGYGRARTLKATPGTGMQFVKWIVSGSAALSAADTVEVNAIAMYSDCGVIAEFAPRPNDLLVHVRVNGNTGVPDPSTGLRVDADGTQLASGQSKTYHYGDNAKLTPVIPPGGTYVFNRWETTGSPVKNAPGDAGVSAPLSNPGYVAILGPQTVYAHYTSVHRVTLNVETRGGGTGGTVTLDRSASPLLPRTESGNTYTYYYNDPCGMTASAAPGYRFLHWSIDDGSGNPPSTSTAARLSTGIHGDLTVTAVFAKEYTLTFAVIPRIDGTGQWDRTGGWLNKPAENTTFATYTAYHGERITAIEAVPNEDYDFGFVKWTTDAAALDTAGQPVDGSTSITTSLVVAGPHTLTASFTQVGREIKIIANITVDGVLDIGKTSGLGVFANGSTVPGSVTETKLAHGEEKAYYKGDRATLDATVPLALRDTYVFMAWEEGDAATREFTPLLASRTVTAHYRTKAKLTMAISPAGIGTTVPSVGEHPLPPDSERDYYVGKVIPTVSTDLTPDTLDYYAFTGWTTVGGAGPSNPAATITSIGLDVREKTLTANYVPGHRLEVRVKYESETDASQPVQFTTVPGSRDSQASGGVSLPGGGTNSAGIWQPGPEVCYDSLRTMPAGADVEIRAYAASPYYRFAGWIQNEGDTPSGGPNLVVRMDEPKTYTAVFERVRVQLKVHTVPADVSGVKAEAVTKAKLIAGGGVEPRVYEVFYGHNPVLEASSTNSEFGFSRWIRGGSYTALLPGEVAITTNPWTPGELVAPVTEVMAVFTGGGGTRRLFLFTEPEDSVDIHHVDAPGAISRTYTTMTFPDGKTRPVCIAYVAVSSESTYTLIDIHADSAAKDQPGDRLTSDGASYGFVHWEAEEYNFDRGAADGYLQDAYSADTKIKYPRSTELTGDGSLYYTAIYGPPGGHLLVLRLDLGNEDGSPLDIDERYKDDFKQIIGFNDLLGNINGSTRNRSGNPVLFVNRVVPEKRAIFSGEHDETFSADEVFKASPYNIYQWTHERPFGTVIARATGDNPTFVMGGTSVPATPAPAPAAAAAPSAAAAAAPSAAAAAPYAWSGWGWVWGHGGWGWVRQSSAGTDYGVHSGVTGESERVTAYVDLLQNRVSMTTPAFIQPPTWPTTPVVANPGDFTFLLYDVTQVPMDIFLAKTIDSPPAPYVKQAMRATGGTPPVLNLTSVPANYRHAGWSLDGSTTAAFAGSGFTWASWPSRWPKKLEEDIEVTPVYIRQMEVTATLRASDEAVGGFGRNFGDKVEFMGRGTIDKGTLTLSSTRDYGSIVQFKAKPDASQHHVLEKWIVEKATADGGTVFDPADTQEFLEDSDAAEILLELAVDCPIKVTAVFGYKKFPFHANVADSLDGAKHGKVM
ncbi:MAG: hypothetical protein LBC18_02930, partial [Opitutaceae bacterium]|nr:hypothetical protein [Opitutaceae bacterium]